VDLSITTRDILKMIPVLIATPATALFYGRQSGVTGDNWTKATIGSGNSPLVMHAASLSLSRTAYGQVQLDGTVRSDGTEAQTALLAFLDAQAAPTETLPNYLWQIQSVSHDPGGTPLTIVHPVDLTLRVTGILRTDYGDTDVGLSAVDIAGYRYALDLTVCDSGKDGANSWQTVSALIANGTKDLAITIQGVGQQATQTLTIRNVKFTGNTKTMGRDYTGHRTTGVINRLDPGAAPTLRTIDAATPADRIINFADAA